jgi:hypothetical protein
MALKVGTENKRNVIIASVLGAVVLILVGKTLWDTFGPSGTPAPSPAPTVVSAPAATPTARTQTARNTNAHEATKVPSSLASLDPTLHPEWMAQAESLEYTGKGRNIFSLTSAPIAIEQPHASVRQTAAMAAPVPTGPPPPPPIDLKFFGYEAQAHTGLSAANAPRKAFLLHGDDVFIANAGDIVDHRYKVVQIAPTSVEVEDIPYHNTQTLPLVQN